MPQCRPKSSRPARRLTRSSTAPPRKWGRGRVAHAIVGGLTTELPRTPRRNAQSYRTLRRFVGVQALAAGGA
jgi:hypothetical protein